MLCSAPTPSSKHPLQHGMPPAGRVVTLPMPAAWGTDGAAVSQGKQHWSWSQDVEFESQLCCLQTSHVTILSLILLLRELRGWSVPTPGIVEGRMR